MHDAIFHDYHPYDRHALSNNPVVDQFTTFIQAGTDACVWRVTEPKFTAVMLFHSLHGAVDHAVTLGIEANRERLIRTVSVFAEQALSSDLQAPA